MRRDGDPQRENRCSFLSWRFDPETQRDAYSVLLCTNGAARPRGLRFVASERYATGDALKTASTQFRSTLEAALRQQGWLDTAEINGKLLTPWLEYGEQEHTWGLLRLDYGAVRVVLLSEHLNKGRLVAQSEGAFLVCPCTVSYSVFISDPIPPSDLCFLE